MKNRQQTGLLHCLFANIFSKPSRNGILSLFIAILFSGLGKTAIAKQVLTPPEDILGFKIGADYHLANYTQLEKYWQTIAEESPRMELQDIGKTSWGRTQWMAVITAPENFSKLDEYQSISKKLAQAEGINDEEAKHLAEIGKGIVWIDGGLHSTEVVSVQQLLRLSYELVSKNDKETQRLLDDLIILLVPANPDGTELVPNWYMRNSDKKSRSSRNVPELYQRYVGHDNNRDFYMNSQPESKNMSRIMYQEWFPQIMFNHHQSGPAGQIVFLNPFRDPPNPNYSSMLMMGNQSVGLAIHNRLVAEGKGGSAMRDTTTFSSWYNGNLRTTGYFHNQIGILSEIKGHPTPSVLPFYPDRQLKTSSFPLPHTPGEWHLDDALEYSMTMNRALLDYASRNKDTVLYNRYLMGRNNITAGSQDSWTIKPRAIYQLEAEIRRESPEDAKKLTNGPRRARSGIDKRYLKKLRTPENRNPRAYIISPEQADFSTAVKFLNILKSSGISVYKANSSFTINDNIYPAGSFVVKTAQAFRGHVLDMFEPQDHPDDVQYEGGPAIPPYDSAGYTLAFQMGIEFDRILDAFEAPLEKVAGVIEVKGVVSSIANASGYLLSHEVNDVTIAVNRLLKADHQVYWLQQEQVINGKSYPVGTIYVKAKLNTASILQYLARKTAFNAEAIAKPPVGKALKLNAPRVGIWDRYGGSMSSGWTQFVLDSFEFPYEVVYPQELDQGKLNKSYDALVFVKGAIPKFNSTRKPKKQPEAKSIPKKYHKRLGHVSADKTIPQLATFVNQGGSMLTIGSSAYIAKHFSLPLSNHLVDSLDKPLPKEEFYIPPSILNIKVDNSQPLAYGVSESLDIVFTKTPVLRLDEQVANANINKIGWYESYKPLRSGWAWGEDRLQGGAAVTQAKVGTGNVFIFGPEILFRSQSHAAFKLFFNGLYLAAAEKVTLGE